MNGATSFHLNKNASKTRMFVPEQSKEWKEETTVFYASQRGTKGCRSLSKSSRIQSLVTRLTSSRLHFYESSRAFNSRCSSLLRKKVNELSGSKHQLFYPWPEPSRSCFSWKGVFSYEWCVALVTEEGHLQFSWLQQNQRSLRMKVRVTALNGFLGIERLRCRTRWLALGWSIPGSLRLIVQDQLLFQLSTSDPSFNEVGRGVKWVSN